MRSKISPNMDVLIFIGSTSAFFYIYMVHKAFTDPEIIKNYLFFENSCYYNNSSIIGNVLEKKSVKKRNKCYQGLKNLTKM